MSTDRQIQKRKASESGTYIRLLCVQIERENPKRSMVLENESYEVHFLDLWTFNLT